MLFIVHLAREDSFLSRKTTGQVNWCHALPGAQSCALLPAYSGRLGGGECGGTARRARHVSAALIFTVACSNLSTETHSWRPLTAANCGTVEATGFRTSLSFDALTRLGAQDGYASGPLSGVRRTLIAAMSAFPPKADNGRDDR